MNREAKEKIEEVKKKAQVFFERHTFIFVKAIKPNGGYELRNGFITEQPSPDFFMIYDLETKEEFPIFFIELIKDGSIFEPSRKEVKE